MSKANRKQKINSLANDNTFGLHGSYRKSWEPDRAYEHKMSRKELLDEQDRDIHDGYQALANAVVARAYKDYVSSLLFGINAQNYDAGAFLKSKDLEIFTDMPGDKLIAMAKQEVKLIKSLTKDYNEALFLKYKKEGKLSISLSDFKSMRRDKAIGHAVKLLENKLNNYGDISTDEMFLNLAKSRYDNLEDSDGNRVTSKQFYDQDPKRESTIKLLSEVYNRKPNAIKRIVEEQKRLYDLRYQLKVIELNA